MFYATTGSPIFNGVSAMVSEAPGHEFGLLYKIHKSPLLERHVVDPLILGNEFQVGLLLFHQHLSTDTAILPNAGP